MQPTRLIVRRSAGSRCGPDPLAVSPAWAGRLSDPPRRCAAGFGRLALTLGWLLICACSMSARVRAGESLPQVTTTQPPSVAAAPSSVQPAPIPIERIAPSIAEAAHLLRAFSAQRVPGRPSSGKASTSSAGRPYGGRNNDQDRPQIT
ncbi:hypothetical protein [Lamprocystis purpurea]|uniref:hypothetical protein n=1 Tax=Lamprocystis purpurea TaxID=61598 RepID=UPI000366E520|nr:hypothetical protein [Lamprocystis purpurea]